MLVTFSTPAYADITMFGDVAIRILKMMGHSATIPGAILAEDVPPALERLKTAIEAEQQLPEPEKSGDDENEEDEDDEPAVSLSNRALPLIELLKAAAISESNVMWDKQD